MNEETPTDSKGNQDAYGCAADEFDLGTAATGPVKTPPPGKNSVPLTENGEPDLDRMTWGQLHDMYKELSKLQDETQRTPFGRFAQWVGLARQNPKRPGQDFMRRLRAKVHQAQQCPTAQPVEVVGQEMIAQQTHSARQAAMAGRRAKIEALRKLVKKSRK